MQVGDTPFLNKPEITEKKDKTVQSKKIEIPQIKTDEVQEKDRVYSSSTGDATSQKTDKFGVEKLGTEETIPENIDEVFNKICDKDTPFLDKIDLLKVLFHKPELEDFVYDLGDPNDFFRVRPEDMAEAREQTFLAILDKIDNPALGILLVAECSKDLDSYGLKAYHLKNEIPSKIANQLNESKLDQIDTSIFNYLIANHKNNSLTESLCKKVEELLTNNENPEKTTQFLDQTSKQFIQSSDDNKSYSAINAIYSSYLITNWEKHENTILDNKEKILSLIKNSNIEKRLASDKQNANYPPNLVKFLSEYKFRDDTHSIFQEIVKPYCQPILENKWPELKNKWPDIQSQSTELKNVKMKPFFLNIRMPSLVFSKILLFSRAVVSDTSFEKSPPTTLDGACDVIFNQKGYITDAQKSEYKEGVPLSLKKGDEIIDVSDPDNQSRVTLKEEIPIGYNVYIPKNIPTKAVIVQVYGGYNPDMKDKAFKPGNVQSLDKYLIDQGIAVIKLNLADYISASPSLQQSLQSHELYSKLHASIDAFYNTIKNDPASLHKDLEVLKDKPLYLFGSSFGGLLTVRHSEIYSDTFDGYLSHEGALSLKQMEKTESISYQKKAEDVFKSLNAISAIDEVSNAKKNDRKIKHIEKPILIMQAFDDNRVNLKAALDWFKRAKKNDKGDLINLSILEEGSFEKSKVSNAKGHYTPDKSTKAFQTFANVISDFIFKRNDDKTPIANQMQAHRSGILGNKFYRAAGADKKFVSDAFRIYEKQNLDGLNAGHKVTKKAVKAYVDNNWKTFSPLYKTASLLDILSTNNLTDLTTISNAISENSHTSHIEKALTQFLPAFIQYLKELNVIDLDDELDIKLMAKNPELIAKFREVLLESGRPINENMDILEKERLANINEYIKEGKLMLIKALFSANPDLLNNYFPEEIDETSAKTNLVSAIWKNEKYLALLKEVAK